MDHTPLIQKGWLRALVFLIAWFMLQVGMYTVIYFIEDLLNPGTGKEPGYNLHLFILSIVGLAANLLIVWLFRTKIDRKTVQSLGFKWQHAQSHGYTGFFAAILLLCFGSLVLTFTGNLHFIGLDFNPFSIFSYLLIMMLVAFSEELVVRGYLLNNLLESFPKWIALLISAILFSLFHLFNPGITLLSTLGVFTGGLLLGVNYIYTRNLWFGIFFHFAWNFLQGPILGFKVSGIEMESLLVQTTGGSTLLTGGPFGFEASLLSIALTFLLSVFLYFFYEQKKTQVLV